jgi:hypothetical protein
MPNVVGRQLDIALQDIKLAGFSGEVDVAGGGMLGIIDKSNWKVCTQTPEAGKAVTKTPHVSVDRACGADAPSSTATSSVTAADDNATQADPAESAEPTVSETPELKPLTRATSADFKHLLKLTGPNIPDTIGVGQNLRVVAKVDTFITNQCLFLLDPVSTQVR